MGKKVFEKEAMRRKRENLKEINEEARDEEEKAQRYDHSRSWNRH